MRHLWLAVLFPVAAARAEPLPPACNPARDGVQLCMNQQICSCAYDRGGLLTGRQPGWHWSCDILQQCEADAPPDLGPPPSIAPGQLNIMPNLNLPTNPATPSTTTTTPQPAPQTPPSWRRP